MAIGDKNAVLMEFDVIDDLNSNELNKPLSANKGKELNDLKAPINNPMFTGFVNGISNEMVGLGNVTNDKQVKRTELGKPNGVPVLDNEGLILPSYLPLGETPNTIFPGDKGKKNTDDIEKLNNIVADLTKSGLTMVPCNCTYNTTTKIFALTKQYPDQILSNNFTVIFTAPNDYVPGATLTLDGETYTTAYADSDAPVIAGAFRQNAVVTLNFQKLPGGG